ncbi:MAG: MMPL family transporter [Deltaproteobacteria bacterium]|nr:MMPL family transporter [Deltaproteobacteria bacterium]
MGRMLKQPLLVVLIFIAITIIFGWRIPQISFRTSIYDMVVDSLPATARYNTFKEVFGSDEIIRVVIRTDGIFTPKNFSVVEEVSGAIEQIPGVKRVISLPVIKKAIEMSRKWDLQKFREMIQPVTLFKKNLISEDQKSTILTVILTVDADKERVIHDIQYQIDNTPKSVTAYQIGMPLVSQAMARYTENDFKRLPPITLLLVAVLLWVIFRNIPVIIVVLGTVVSALIWTMGLMGWLQIPLSMMTMVVPVFLIAVGTAYCMHVISTYLTCSRNSSSRLQAVLESYQRVFLPTILTVLTTAIGLTSLLVNRIPAIHEFALISCFGLFSLLVILLTAFPAALMLLPQTKLRSVQKKNGGIGLDQLLEFIVRLNLKHRKIILYAIVSLVLLGIVGMFFMRVETNPIGFFKAHTPISGHFHDIYQDLSGSFPINVIMDGGEDDFFEDPQNVAIIQKLQQYLETLPGVDKTISFADYMQLVNYATNRYSPDFYMIPKEGFEIRMLINSYKTMLGDDMLTRFMNPAYSKANILLLTHISSSRDFLAIRDTILSHVKTDFPEVPAWEVTGFGMVAAESSHLLTWGQAKSFSLTMVFIFVIMLILFLSTRVGFIAILPNVFPIVINFGIMGWLGIPLSMVTSLIASIAIGLAVDDTIHYLYRYNREFKKDLDKDRSLRDSILHVGRPVLFTTISIGLGFAVLLFSSFEPTSIFGLLMVITMLAAVIGDLLILPALMLNVELVTAWDLLKLMPTLSGISSSAVHELNQPLNVIKMGSDYLKMKFREGTAVKTEHLAQVVNEIGTQVDRVSEIIRRLMNFGQKPGFNKEPTDVNKAVQEALVLVENQLKMEDIHINLDLDRSLPYIYAHPTKISEVVFNLLVNACEAIAEKKSTRKDIRNGSRISIRTSIQRKWVRIRVSDNGIGIPAHLINRITEPFFTTKASGTGKGLGLCISKEIVKSYGGRLEAKSDQGRQTDFIMSFPVYAAPINP